MSVERCEQWLIKACCVLLGGVFPCHHMLLGNCTTGCRLGVRETRPPSTTKTAWTQAGLQHNLTSRFATPCKQWIACTRSPTTQQKHTPTHTLLARLMQLEAPTESLPKGVAYIHGADLMMLIGRVFVKPMHTSCLLEGPKALQQRDTRSRWWG